MKDIASISTGAAVLSVRATDGIPELTASSASLDFAAGVARLATAILGRSDGNEGQKSNQKGEGNWELHRVS